MADSLEKLFEEFYHKNLRMDDMRILFKEYLGKANSFPSDELEEFRALNHEVIQLKEKLVEELKGSVDA